MFSSFLYVADECGCVYTRYLQAHVPVLVQAEVKGRLHVSSSVPAGLITFKQGLTVNLMMAILVRVAHQQAP